MRVGSEPHELRAAKTSFNVTSQIAYTVEFPGSNNYISTHHDKKLLSLTMMSF